MKTAIFFSSLNPEAGGEYTLIETIRKEFSENRPDYDVVFCYKGNTFGSYKTVIDGYEWININRGLLNHFLGLCGKRLKRHVYDAYKSFFFKRPSYGFESVWDEIASVEGISLYWFTCPVDELLTTPFVFTEFDMGHRVLPFLPEVSRPAGEMESRDAMNNRLLSRAFCVITGNETGKKEILMNHSIDPEKIRIIDFPISFFTNGEQKKPDILKDGECFFFYPAQFWSHKNHICILDALVKLKEQYGLQPSVYFTGSDKGNRTYIEEQIHNLKLDHQVKNLGFVSFEELNYLYRNAQAMIYASLMGPNNMPPYEAAAHDCPVIITNIPGHLEQMQDAALFFDGRNPLELAERMAEILNSTDLRNSLIKKENKLMEKFDHYSYAKEMIKIMDEFAYYNHTYSD